MSSKHLRGDFNYAWPTAEVAVMGSKVHSVLLQIYNGLHISNHSLDGTLLFPFFSFAFKGGRGWRSY